MDAHHDVARAPQLGGIPCDQCNVFLPVYLMAVTDGGEVTVFGGQLSGHLTGDLRFIMAAPLDELRDRDHGEPMRIGKATQLWRARHIRGVILGDDLAQHTGWAQARQAGQINGGLRMSVPLQNAARPSAQRHHVTWPGEFAGRRVWICQTPDGFCARSRRNTGTARCCIHGHRIGGAAYILVDRQHRR